MKIRTTLTLIVAFGIAVLAVAQTTFPVSHAPDSAIHQDHTEVRADRNDLRTDTNSIADDKAQLQEAIQTQKADLKAGNTAAAKVDASAIRADQQELTQHQHAISTDRSQLRDDQEDLREGSQSAVDTSSTGAPTPSDHHAYNGQSGTVHYGAVHAGK